MRRFKILFLLCIAVGIYYSFSGLNDEKRSKEEESPPKLSNPTMTMREAASAEEAVPEKQEEFKYNLKGSIYEVIGLEEEVILERYGQPDRRDQSPYGYKWWVYKDKDVYTQIGIEGGQAVTLYTVGPKISAAPLLTGEPYQEVQKTFEITNSVDVDFDNSSYQFKLSDKDVSQRPLLSLGNDLYMQLYFDQFTERLSSIRLLTADVLLMHQPYEVYYRGELPDHPLILKRDWSRIQNGVEQQIFDITNMIRRRFEENPVEWHDKVSNVAFGHSQDMAINNYFSHISLEGNGLKERLKKNEVYYFSAGENIAAQYPDGPATVEGWLNSKGHREALLNEDYTHLGVGVYRYYYTQNFLQKPN